MMLFTVINESTLERIDDYALCATPGQFLDEVERVLYTQWELTPATNRVSWAYPFHRGEKVKFAFHGTPTALVWRDATGVIRVKEI
jgi:hypothetical protein